MMERPVLPIMPPWSASDWRAIVQPRVLGHEMRDRFALRLHLHAHDTDGVVGYYTPPSKKLFRGGRHIPCPALTRVEDNRRDGRWERRQRERGCNTGMRWIMIGSYLVVISTDERRARVSVASITSVPSLAGQW